MDATREALSGGVARANRQPVRASLGLLKQMLRAGVVVDGRKLPTGQGTPQGGVVSSLLSNILLTPFDWEMRRRGYRLTRYADDCAPRRRGEGAMIK